MYQANCKYCEKWEYSSSNKEEAKEQLANHLLREHKDKLRSIPKRGGKSPSGISTKGSKCKSGKDHKIKEDLTSDLKCPVCGYDYSNYIAGYTASMMIQEKEEK